MGFRELTEFGTGEKIFTIILIVIGSCRRCCTTFTLVVQLVVEGQLSEFVGRRRMDRQINQLRNHTFVCGWGRVGAAVAHDLHIEGHDVVVVDENAERVRDLPFPTVVGDATRDETLRAAGIEHARA